MKRFIPLMIFCIAITVIICIPLRVMSYGFIPSDDAMRHTAKAVSGKSWDQILVLRPEFKIDPSPGWHAILEAIYRMTGCDQDTLMLFSVAALFILFCLIPAFSLDYPETWLVSLLAMVVMAPYMAIRLLSGRPYLFPMSGILLLCFLWPRLKEKKAPYAVMGVLTAIFALSTWIHGSWYLFALPILCFFISREWKSGIRLTICAIIGVITGACLTGSPYLFLRQEIIHMSLVFGSASSSRLLVTELQPFSGEPMMVLFILGMLVWRKIRGKWDARVVYNPIFILAAAGWVLGFIAYRFWLDWGITASIFWIATELNAVFKEKMPFGSRRRALLALAISCVLFLAMTADIGSRWTRNLTTEYLSQDDTSYAGWLPEPGGIIYSNDMTLFFQTFFKNAKAPWRYMLGFEAAMMPADDVAIFRKIQWNFSMNRAFEPWVKKMRPQDRLIIRGAYNAPPDIAGLEWRYAVANTWIGRLPKKR